MTAQSMAGSGGWRTSRGWVQTDRAVRYLERLAIHLDRMSADAHARPHGGARMPSVVEATRIGDGVAVVFDVGRIEVSAGGEALRLSVAAEDESQLHLLQTLIASRIETIGRRDALSVRWER